MTSSDAQHSNGAAAVSTAPAALSSGGASNEIGARALSFGAAATSFAAAVIRSQPLSTPMTAAVTPDHSRSISFAAARGEFEDHPFEIFDPQRTTSGAPNEIKAPPIGCCVDDDDFARNDLAALKSPTPVLVTARKRSGATIPEGMPASEVFASANDALLRV
jgi:hypothetical protein